MQINATGAALFSGNQLALIVCIRQCFARNHSKRVRNLEFLGHAWFHVLDREVVRVSQATIPIDTVFPCFSID